MKKESELWANASTDESMKTSMGVNLSYQISSVWNPSFL